jgi:hypothetical protein
MCAFRVDQYIPRNFTHDSVQRATHKLTERRSIQSWLLQTRLGRASIRQPLRITALLQSNVTHKIGKAPVSSKSGPARLDT